MIAQLEFWFLNTELEIDYMNWFLCVRGQLEAPLNNCVVHAEFQVLSLLVEEGRSTFGGVAKILAKFSMITKGK